MNTEIHERTRVLPGGRIQFESKELIEGSEVELHIRPAVDPDEIDTTEYLLSTKANRENLLEGIKDVREHPENLIGFESVDELEKFVFSKEGIR